MFRYFEINEKGHNIRCKIYYRDLSLATRAVMFVHGFAGHKDNKTSEKFSEKMVSKHKDLILIIFDLPCHGDDVKKKLRLEDCDDYIKIVYDHIKSHYGVDHIFALANSFGAYLTLRFISLYGNIFDKIVCRSPAICLYESMTTKIMTDKDREKIAKSKDALVGFDRKVSLGPSFLDEIRNFDIRKKEFIDFADDILIIHGTDDELIPFEETRKFCDDNIIELVAIDHGDHRLHDPELMDTATKNTVRFFGL